MKCSKCQYITFDTSDRCRNCGYEFSFTVETDPLDLPIRTGDEPSGPLTDFSIADLDALEPLAPPSRPAKAPPRDQPFSPRRSAPSGELPLFRDRRGSEDAPLVSLPASPRAPVAVRKSSVAPKVPQRMAPAPARERELEPELELGFSPDQDRDPRRASPSHERGASERGTGETARLAGIVPRVVAAGVDFLLLAGIDLFVLYYTLKLCGLEFGDVLLLPMMPFAAFIAFLNGGYIAAFTTAGGQTIGKMLTGIRVVTADEGARTHRVTVGAAALRTVGYVISALPAGLGFLLVFLGAERRGLHDRLADTRVVKA